MYLHEISNITLQLPRLPSPSFFSLLTLLMKILTLFFPEGGKSATTANNSSRVYGHHFACPTFNIRFVFSASEMIVSENIVLLIAKVNLSL